MTTNSLQDLANKIPAALGTHAVYGEPVDLAGTTLIPVAYAAFGFGAGEGSGTDDQGQAGEGVGGGGGGVTMPIGAYVSRDGVARFEPNLIALLAVGVPLLWVAGRALARIIRAFKH